MLEVILSCIDKEIEGFQCMTPQLQLLVQEMTMPLWDDSGLVVDDSGGYVVEKLRMNSQQHEKFLYVTGGKLALRKCFWTLIQ